MRKNITARARAARLSGDTLRVFNSLSALAHQARNFVPAVQARESHPANWYRIENQATADEAHVYIYDEIGFWGKTAAEFVDELNSIASPRLVIHLNSPGGEVWDGVAIHTALMASDAHITINIDGLAASAASFIAMAGDRIVMARHATMMIHDASGLVWGNPAEVREYADLLDKLSDNIADMYALQADGTAEQWREKMSAETWYTGREALAAGLVDEITQPDDPDGEPDNKSTAPVTRLSLAAFNFAGRADAPEPVIEEVSDGDSTVQEQERPPDESTKEVPEDLSDWSWKLAMALHNPLAL